VDVFIGSENDLRNLLENSKVPQSINFLNTQPEEWGCRTAEQILAEMFPGFEYKSEV
jgi:hypothetical protein